MKTLIICKASTTIGFGHLVRARTFAEKLLQTHYNIDVDFAVVGDPHLIKLIGNLGCPIHFCSEDSDLVTLNGRFDVVFFDSIELSHNVVEYLKSKSLLSVSLSPVFNQMDKMDLMFTRTKYSGEEMENNIIKTYKGLQYTLVQADCYKIDTNFYISNLSKSNFHIAISMGGGDAARKSLQVVKTLKNLFLPATIWVMLGEGYKYSYDEFIEAVERDSEHEIILAKTNKSMWSVLNNCSLLITTSGITSYEAAYAGLPTITYFDSLNQFYLIRELIEKGATMNGGLFGNESLAKLNKMVADLYHNRGRLVEMHKNASQLIDNTAAFKIFDVVSEELKQRAKAVDNKII